MGTKVGTNNDFVAEVEMIVRFSTGRRDDLIMQRVRVHGFYSTRTVRIAGLSCGLMRGVTCSANVNGISVALVTVIDNVFKECAR